MSQEYFHVLKLGATYFLLKSILDRLNRHNQQRVIMILLHGQRHCIGAARWITFLYYHANIRTALKHVLKNDLISTNPADKIERPKKNESSVLVF